MMKVLVAIDGSDNALRALDQAAKLAGCGPDAASLVLVNVHDDVALRSATQFVSRDSVDAYLDDLATGETGVANERAAASGIPHRLLKLRGPVGQTIAETAASEGCAMIVLGYKGRTALRDLLIGSVAQRVLSLAQVPVLLVK
jgi:nucleotide-binding universal stress UspA family protein